jgi:PIN domain nuclease of toxin-antitoxin system
MKYLLDTHTFLFCAFDSPQLGKKARQLIVNGENEVSVSVVSFWEISLKFSLGKLNLKNIRPEELLHACKEMGFGVLDLSAPDAASYYELKKLPHRDPFDRMLIWQAIRRNLTLISKDASFKEYEGFGLKVLC